MRRLLFASLSLFLISCAPLPQAGNTGVPVDRSERAGEINEPTAMPTTGTGSLPEAMLPGGLLSIGDPNAPHTLLLFTHYSCRYCAEYEEGIVPMLQRDFLASGQLRMIVVALPLQKYAESAMQGSLLRCASAQGNGQWMHGLLFATPRATVDTLTRTEGHPLDMDSLRTCLEDERTRADLATQATLARSLGVSLVPTTFVDGERIVGLPLRADLQGMVRRFTGQDN